MQRRDEHASSAGVAEAAQPAALQKPVNGWTQGEARGLGLQLQLTPRHAHRLDPAPTRRGQRFATAAAHDFEASARIGMSTDRKVADADRQAQPLVEPRRRRHSDDAALLADWRRSMAPVALPCE